MARLRESERGVSWIGWIVRLCLLCAILSFVPVIVGRLWLRVTGDQGSLQADQMSLMRAVEADLKTLYDGAEAADLGAERLEQVRESLERYAREHERFKELSEAGTVKRETFDKLKSKALQIAAELVRTRSELDKYRSDAREAVSVQRSSSESSLHETARLNATYAALLKRAGEKVNTLKQRVRAQEDANERLEKLLASAQKESGAKSSQTLDQAAAESKLEQNQAEQERIASLEKEAAQARDDLSKVQQKTAALEEENRYLKAKNLEQKRQKHQQEASLSTTEPKEEQEDELQLDSETKSDGIEDDDACLERVKELGTQVSILKSNNTRLKRAGAGILKTKKDLDVKVKELEAKLKVLQDQLRLQQSKSTTQPEHNNRQSGDEFSSLGFGQAQSQPRIPQTAPPNNFFTQHAAPQGLAGNGLPANGYNQYPYQPAQQIQQPQQQQQQPGGYGQVQLQGYQPQIQQSQPQYNMFPSLNMQQQQPVAQGGQGGQAVASVYGGLGIGQQQQQQQYGNVKPLQSPGGCARKFEFNSDRPGGHYRQQQVDSARRCRDLCMSEYQCQSWVYVKAQAGCYLKDSVYPPMENSCCVSGPRC